VLYLTGPKTFSKPKGFKDICRFYLSKQLQEIHQARKKKPKLHFLIVTTGNIFVD
jgi:hypothetical protein